MKMIVFLVGKLWNLVNLLHNSKQLIGSKFYSSRVWVLWEATEFPRCGSGEAWEHFWRVFCSFLTSNTCSETFPSKSNFCCALCHGTLGTEQGIFHVWELTPSCPAREDNSGWLCCRDSCNPTPCHRVVVGTSSFHNRCLAVPFPSLIPPIKNKLWGPLGVISHFLQIHQQFVPIVPVFEVVNGAPSCTLRCVLL